MKIISDKILLDHLRNRPLSLRTTAYEKHLKIYDVAAADRIEALLANVEVLSALVDEYRELVANYEK